MVEEYLKLQNQLCFPVYAVSRLITKQYKPFLDELKITYPQYLVLLVLWETDNLPVNDIAKKLFLNTNTITPLLKRMEQQNIIERNRSLKDERKVIVTLTDKGISLKKEAAKFPEHIATSLCGDLIGYEELIDLKEKLNAIIKNLTS